MIKKTSRLLISLFGLVLTNAFAQPNFEASEHIAAGDKVQLPQFQEHHSLHLPNDLQMTYSALLAMGDFYEVVGQNISQPDSLEQRKKLFLAAFQSLANDPKSVKEAKDIFAVIQDEQNAVEEGMRRGEKPETIYSRIDMENNRRWNCITGGGCDITNWFTQPGRYMLLATQDLDHFGDNAWKAYEAGHQAALEQAASASKTQDLAQLEVAYAMDAFASHFLSDLFATGHMRTPRVELPMSVFPSAVGMILASYMHKEDNKYGLHVHNIQGEQWIAYGDSYFFNENNKEHREKLEKTLQLSVNEVFAAYQTGEILIDTKVKQWIPIPDEQQNTQKIDIATLFYWDAKNHLLYRRLDVNHIYDARWTVDWWGWTTLILLSQTYGLDALSQIALIQAGLGDQAAQDGMIKDTMLLQYIKSKTRK